ncbi:MAG: hypothetical protein U1C97_02785, partial [Candidatus Gracilibacteria bacterium]|nr:hypothetical protein [Candidatus Gracilibacteria bacterium]
RLLCLLHTEEGDFSLGVLSGDLALSSDCLKSARRAGFERGKLFPVVYRAATEKLEASRSYEFSPSMSRQTPIVTQFDPVSGIITLNEGLSSTSKGIQILSSPSHQFSSFNRAVANQITTSTYGIPSLSGCPGTCFLKVLILLENSDSLVLATASDTIIYSESPDPLLDLCFVNSPLFKNLFQAEDLHFQIRKNSGEIIDLNYQPNSGCYERVLPTESGSGAAPGWSDFVSTSAFLPTETMVISTNGYRNSVITIPPQKHFARLKPSALHLLSSSALTFEHSHLVVQDDLSFRSEPKKEGTLPTPLQTSYQISSLDSKTTLVPVTRGNVVLKKMGENNALEQSIPAPAPINETLLFPGFGNTLSTPNTIRIIPPEELLTRPLQVNLELPRNSQVKILFKPLVRSDITSQQSIQEGIRFDEQTLFFTAENLSGQISIPLKIELPLPTDTSRYALTFPPTPLPADIGIATLKTQLMLNTEHPSSLPQSTLLDPLLLRSAAPGSSYTEVIDFGALETYQGFEVLESGFPSTQCAAF